MSPTPPFAVHPSWQGEFARRWQVASPLLLVAFVLVQAVVVAAMAIALAVADAPVTGFAVLLVVPPACYLAWFVLARRYLVRPRFWGVRVGALGCVQLCGVALPSAVAGGVVAAVCPALATLAIAGGTVAAHRARRVLFSPEGAAPAATSLPLQWDLRMHPPRLFGSVTADVHALHWHLKPRGLYGLPAALVRGSVPLAEITGVRVVEVGGPGAPLIADGVPVPAGPAVAVGTVRGEVVLAVEDAPTLAHLLDLRLRLAGQGGWAAR
ncbi:hypothetical protein [Prauserella muralis]|uniref:Uncharacterized protein n=1 Tax=Prauserella muralis TaxID=588067 RepID=A0A2V4B9H1_9PSEU|nr:hypothetical protein [Prauserella muralis]PXY31816.1 hypothetical protein BAY60_05630 [Prauserella muralis]TWE13776.1 hypothetical protein FHX69_5904 [Prauserella muralis]